MDELEPIRIPIDGILDLHTFRPGEVKDLLVNYIAVCLEEGITEIRVIHGKGTGRMRGTVHGVLERLREVKAFRQADPEEGGWGATIVDLQRTD